MFLQNIIGLHKMYTGNIKKVFSWLKEMHLKQMRYLKVSHFQLGASW